MKSHLRAERRKELAKQKRRARRIYAACENPVKYANHLATCSCWMCGNPRKYLGEKTIQEIRAELRTSVE